MALWTSVRIENKVFIINRGAYCNATACTLLAVVRRLDETGIPTQNVALHKPTLDDVFLTLTGRGAAEAEAERAETKKSGRRGRRERSEV